MEALFVLFIIFVIVKHPVVSVLVIAGIILLCCLPGGESHSSDSCDDEDLDNDTVPWYKEKDSIFNPTYYENGTSRYKTASGYQYSNGVNSWINTLTGVEYRSNGTEARPVWYDPDTKEIYDSESGEYLGTETENDWGISKY